MLYFIFAWLYILFTIFVCCNFVFLYLYYVQKKEKQTENIVKKQVMAYLNTVSDTQSTVACNKDVYIPFYSVLRRAR